MHLILESNDLIKCVLVFQKNARGVAAPHVNDVAQKNQVCHGRIALQLVQKPVKPRFIDVLISQMLIRNCDDCQC